jgi:hypothetical protein
MLFIETDVFSSELARVWTDDDYAEFQAYLAANPVAGDLISGTGGLRKVRWAATGRGKSGGARVIYYYPVALDQIWLLMIYRKARKDDLTEKEKRILRAIVQRWNDG